MTYLTLGFSIASFLAAAVIALTTPATSASMKPSTPRPWISTQSQAGLPAAPPALR